MPTCGEQSMKKDTATSSPEWPTIKNFKTQGQRPGLTVLVEGDGSVMANGQVCGARSREALDCKQKKCAGQSYDSPSLTVSTWRRRPTGYESIK